MARTSKSGVTLSDVLARAELAIVGPDVAARAAESRRQGPRERSKEQQAIDMLVKQAHAKWVAAGRPDKFDESAAGSVRVPADPENVNAITVSRAIQRSGKLLDLSLRFGQITEPDGYVRVVFVARDKVAK